MLHGLVNKTVGAMFPYSEASAIMATQARMTRIHDATTPPRVVVVGTGLIVCSFTRKRTVT